MAARKKKAVAKKAPTKKRTTKAVVKWEDRLAKMAQAEESRVPSTAGNNISIKGGVFTYQGGDLGETMDVIILGFAHGKVYYDRPFDEDSPSAPACGALSLVDVDMVPLEDAPDPQAEACADCWANKFESDYRGRGKACRDQVLLAVVPADIDDFEEPEIAVIKVPPTSRKAFTGYAKKIQRLRKRPLWSVTTTLGFDPDADYETLTFEFAEDAAESQLDELAVLAEDDGTAFSAILTPPDFSQYEPPSTKRPRKKAPARKRATKKRAASKKKTTTRKRTKYS